MRIVDLSAPIVASPENVPDLLRTEIRGVRVMGIDAWGWDHSQIERLANLDRLPPSEFTVACFPLRLVGGSAAPARVVAILDSSGR